ncbi:MAG: AraC family transcriptional regulator [Gammaproteobacteria bacterium]|nr:AraC family transcriptional regulator [Gammaproteobacteria bacterium]
MSEHFSVAVHFLKLLTDYVESKNLPSTNLLQHVGLHEESLQDPNGRIPFEQFSRLCDLTADMLHEPNFGLKLGQSIRPGHLGSHGFALMSCSTPDELIQQHIRYSALTIDAIHIDIVQKGNEIIRYTRSNLLNQTPISKLQEQLHVSTSVTLARWFVNRMDLNPNWISFQHTKPDDIHEYTELFRCPIKFSQPETAISIDANFFNLTLPHANPQLRRIMADLCAQLLKQLGNALEPLWLAKVRKAVLEAFQDGLPDIKVAALKSGISEEELKERLAERGLSFRGFVDDLRQALAVGYIRDPNLSLVDIAYLLGFSEQSAFQRAFKRWTGMTPGDYRKH